MRVVLPYNYPYLLPYTNYPYLLPSTNYPYVTLLPRAVCVCLCVCLCIVCVLCVFVCVCVCAVELLMHWLLASRVPPPMEYGS